MDDLSLRLYCEESFCHVLKLWKLLGKRKESLKMYIWSGYNDRYEKDEYIFWYLVILSYIDRSSFYNAQA